VKVETGIFGFDKLIDGGFPPNKQILITGEPGTGKTIFCLEFLYRGALEFNEKGLFVSFEEDEASLKAQAEQFGWNFDRLKSMITIMTVPASEITDSTIGDINRFIKTNNIKRVIIDSLTTLAINIPSARGGSGSLTSLYVKRFMYQFVAQLREASHGNQNHSVTTLLISQTKKDFLSFDGVSEFVCDGIIRINYEAMGGNFSRTLTIRKMRQVKHNEDIHPLEISDKGLKIHELQ
jgi:KaiC/GvpD/RAD55 family RecA-like ATPase